jgi:hypothetical protein
MHSRAIEQYKRGLRLTEAHQEILVGLLLGDGCLETQNAGRTYRLKIEQSARHEAYVRHIHELFSEWVLRPPRRRLSRASNGTISINWAFQTVSHEAFQPFGLQFYGGGRKKVPGLIADLLTPRGFAYWFMDDGSMKSAESKGVVLNTQAYTAGDVERLIAVLRSRFGLQAKIREQSDGPQIYVAGRSYERVSEVIEPFLLEEMRYKMPHARRTHLPKT